MRNVKYKSRVTCDSPQSSHDEQVTAIPVEATNLSPLERNKLPDPRWVTEDDADAVTAARRQHEKRIPLDQALKRYGRRRVAS